MALLHWSQRGLAQILDCDDRLVRRWASGDAAVPADIAEWLTDIAATHSAAPPPLAWRRRKVETDKEDVEDTVAAKDLAGMASLDHIAGNPNFRLAEMSWEWRGTGALVAKGKLQVMRESNSPAATIAFEVPVSQMPSRSVFENPQDWIVTLLRRTLRA